MKRFIFMMGVSLAITLIPALVQAGTQSSIQERIENAFAKASRNTPEKSIIKLAREGEITELKELAQRTPASDLAVLLNTHDKNNNNLFHVAKDAQTVQAIASLLRQIYGVKVGQQITQMVDERNEFGETALHAQINAAHPDTFRPLYSYSTLKKINGEAKGALARLKGGPLTIYNQNKAIYCNKIHDLASSKGGYTILQSAQYQATYNEKMAPLANAIGHIVPCLAEN